MNQTWYSHYNVFLLNVHIHLVCLILITLYCSMAIQDMANLFKFIPFTTSSIPIRFILFNFPLKNFIQRLQILLPSQLFAMTLKLVLIQIQSIRMEKYLLKNKPANFCILYIMSTNIFFCLWKKNILEILFLSIMAFLVKKMVPQRSSQLPTFSR